MGRSAYTLSEFVGDLRAIITGTRDQREIINSVRPLAQQLAMANTSLEPRHYKCDEDQGFGVHPLHEEPDHTLWVTVVSWLPGRGAPPHNHGTWAVVAGVDGPEKNIFWKRVDDGSRPGYAEITKVGEKVVGPGEVVSLLPDAVHSVVNETDRVTVSLHVYGRNLNYTGRSQFDPEANTETPFLLTYD